MEYYNLLRPGRIGTMELKNKAIMPGMGTNLAGADGTASDVIINYYARRAEGGVGLIITEVCAPEPEGCVIPGEIDISHRKFMSSLSRIPHAVHAGGAKVALQLAHAGCFASETVTGVRPKSPSGIGTFRLPDENPREMSEEEIIDLIEKYAVGVQRARQIGFDAVEIHGAHGYMPLQFLSGYTNRRTDKWGGSLENRARFAIEIVRRSKKLAGNDYPIIYRISAEEYVPNGVTLEETKKVSVWLQEAGVDAINVSAGTWDSRFEDYFKVLNGEESPEGKNLGLGVGTSVWVTPNYAPRGTLLDYAKEIKKCVSVPVIGVGGITPEMGEELISNKHIDFVCIGRQIIADPDYVKKLGENASDNIKRCLRCNDCLGEVNKSCGISCAINPEAGKEYENYTTIMPAIVKKRVAVIGSGPGGIQAALTASERGHDVTLFKKQNRLGGQLYYVSLPEFKKDYLDYYKYLLNAVNKNNINVRLNR